MRKRAADAASRSARDRCSRRARLSATGAHGRSAPFHAVAKTAGTPQLETNLDPNGARSSFGDRRVGSARIRGEKPGPRRRLRRPEGFSGLPERGVKRRERELQPKWHPGHGRVGGGRSARCRNGLLRATPRSGIMADHGQEHVDGTWEFRHTDGKIHGYIQLSGHGQQTRVDVLLLK